MKRALKIIIQEDDCYASSICYE